MRIRQILLRTHRRLLAWRPDRNNRVVRGLRQTRLSGFKEALKDNDTHYGWRILWIVAFFLCLSYGIKLSLMIYNKYLTSPILHTFHDAGIRIDKIPFPGVTIALPYLLKQSVLDEAMSLYDESQYAAMDEQMEFKRADGTSWSPNDVVKLLYMVNNFCESGNTFGKKFKAIHPMKSLDLHKFMNWVELQNTSLFDDTKDEVNIKKIVPFMKKGLINCSQAIVACLWKGLETKACTELFEAVQTDVGTGCAFNKMPDQVLRNDKGLKAKLHDHGTMPKKELAFWTNWTIESHSFLDEIKSEEKKKEFPRRQVVPGFDEGFSFLLKHPKNNEDVACPAIDSKEYMVCVHHPYEEPRIKLNGCFHVPPKKQVFIKVRPEITLADPNIRSLAKAKRKCLFEKENPLKIYKRYTKNNCFKECFANAVYDECKCTPLSMTGEEELISSPLHWECVKNVTDEFKTEGYGSRCSECYRPCTEIVYRAEATYTELEFEHPQAFNMSKNDSYSLIHVFFDEESVTTHERSLQYDTNELIGIFGGIIGLTNGVDILQMFNIAAGFAIACPVFKIIRKAFQKLVRGCHTLIYGERAEATETSETTSQNTIPPDDIIIHPRDGDDTRRRDVYVQEIMGSNDIIVVDMEGETEHTFIVPGLIL